MQSRQPHQEGAGALGLLTNQSAAVCEEEINDGCNEQDGEDDFRVDFDDRPAQLPSAAELRLKRLEAAVHLKKLPGGHRLNGVGLDRLGLGSGGIPELALDCQWQIRWFNARHARAVKDENIIVSLRGDSHVRIRSCPCLKHGVGFLNKVARQ